ncbi:MAG TPA: hypothetical protein VFD43_13415 [Planctomycetota bacterium]|nr:hypothetical protein [Planctomycetota bacterium]
MTPRALLALTLPLLTLLPACGDSPSAIQARQETVEAWAALRAYGEDQREAFVKELNARIAVLDRQLDELKARSARSTAESRVEIERELTDLQGRRGALAEKLAALEQASKEAWTGARDATVDAFESLADGINAAVDKTAR